AGVIWKKSMFDVGTALLPTVTGLETLTEAVPRATTSAAGTAAVNCLLLVKVVARGLPFHMTTEPGPNPVPLSVSVHVGVHAGAPGTAVSGAKGWFIWATGVVTVIVSVCVPMFPAESVTCTVKLNMPAVVGIPESKPEMLSGAVVSERPGRGVELVK